MAIISSSKETEKTGFQAINKVTGICTFWDTVPNSDESIKASAERGYDPYAMLAEIRLDDAVVLEWAEGAEEIELKDNQWKNRWNYTKAGHTKPNGNIFFVAKTMKSGEALGLMPDPVGKRITLERLVWTRTIEDRNTKEKKESNESNFVFVGGDAEVESIEDYTKRKLTGLAPAAALRTALTDSPRIKTYPAILESIRTGEWEQLGMEIKDDVLVVKEVKNGKATKAKKSGA